MTNNQLPLSTLNGVTLDEFPMYVIVSGNDIEVARAAIIMAKATGSKGASEIHRKLVTPDQLEIIDKYAIVKKITA